MHGVRLIAVGLLLTSAAGIVALSLIPYETLKDHLDPLSVDRDADLNRAEFDEIVLRLRLLAAGFATLAAALVAFGHSIDRVTAAIANAWWTSTRRSPRLLRDWVAAEPRSYLAGFGLVLITGISLRIAFLDVPMRYDEATTYNNFVSKPLYVGLAHYPTPNNHLLHTFLAKTSVTVFGNDPWTVRLPALLAGIAIVPATFALARILYGRTAALLAATRSSPCSPSSRSSLPPGCSSTTRSEPGRSSPPRGRWASTPCRSCSTRSEASCCGSCCHGSSAAVRSRRSFDISARAPG